MLRALFLCGKQALVFDAGMNDTEFVFIYSTFPDSASAARMARVLIEKKLAACVNIHASMVSVYAWRGEIETGPEVAVFIKTRRALADAAIAAARPLHPYTVPAFLLLPIEGGNSDYLEWARAQTITE